MVTEESVKKMERPASDTTRIQIPYEELHYVTLLNLGKYINVVVLYINVCSICAHKRSFSNIILNIKIISSYVSVKNSNK